MLAASLTLGAAVTMAVITKPAPAQNAAVLRFETVSIKQNRSGTEAAMIESPRNGDTVAIRNMSPHMMIGLAYDLPLHDEIYGLPAWTDSSNYDVVAKVAASELPAFHKLLPRERNPMLQGVLESRFHLKCHFEEKPLPGYELVVGKTRPRLQETQGSFSADGDKSAGKMRISRGEIDGTGVRIADLVQVLSQQLGRPVVDGTRLTGSYDFKLNWTPELGTAAPAASVDSGPSIFTAVQEQLGLRLAATKVPVRVLVVDQIDRPDEN